MTAHPRADSQVRAPLRHGAGMDRELEEAQQDLKEAQAHAATNVDTIPVDVYAPDVWDV